MTTNKYLLSSSNKTYNGSNHSQSLDGKKVMLPLLENSPKYTRLQHTQDVKNVAYQIAEKLKGKIPAINLDKLSTMVDWHDIGHCPYAHAGEEELNRLLSENGDIYYDSFYSGYKHNLLSAKILLDERKDISWDIIDGIIKHSAVLPKNFNVRQVKGYNLLKLNYILREKSQSGNASWYTFISSFFEEFPCQHCQLAQPNLNIVNDTKNNKLTICSREQRTNNYCCLVNSCNAKNGGLIARYLLYPYSLTFEGAILYMADEISCLANDIYYYFVFVNNKYKDTNTRHIIKLQVINALNILEAKYQGIKKYKVICDIARNLIENPEEKTKNKFIQQFVKNIKANKYQLIRNIDSVNVYVSQLNEKACLPLLTLNDKSQSIFTQIKKAIYGVIHKDQEIDKDNKNGASKLKKAFEEYYNNPIAFFELKENHTLANDLKEVALQVGIIPSMSSNLERAIQKCKDNPNESNSKLLNAFRREIVFYLARLKEDDLK